MLSNPALTDTLSKFPLFSSRAGSSKEPEPAEEDEPQEGTDGEHQPPGEVKRHRSRRREMPEEEADEEADLQAVEKEVLLRRTG